MTTYKVNYNIKKSTKRSLGKGELEVKANDKREAFYKFMRWFDDSGVVEIVKCEEVNK